METGKNNAANKRSWSVFHSVCLLEVVRRALLWRAWVAPLADCKPTELVAIFNDGLAALDAETLGCLQRRMVSMQGCILAIEAALLVHWSIQSAFSAFARSSAGKKKANADQQRLPFPQMQQEARQGAHLLLVNAKPCGPRGGIYQSSSPQAHPFESPVCSGSWLFIHRPTDDAERHAAGDYPYADHMHGRRRLWEFRIQLKFKERMRGDIYFGCEQDQYYHIPFVEKYISKSVISVLRRAATGMYQTHGDDPSTTQGEPERPGVVFPLWVMDQLIVTPQDEEPPSLCDPDFPTMGMIKADDREAMKTALSRLQFEPGPTFTFGFWCIAQFVDALNWKATPGGIIPDSPLDGLGTHPPCYVTMYALRPREEWRSVRGRHDQRHLDSRKNYIFRLAFWSSLLQPDEKRVKQLTAPPSPPQRPRTPGSKPERVASSWRFCCGDW